MNVMKAAIRIDDEAPLRFEDLFGELTRLLTPYQGASLDNPTDGIVWIPFSKLKEADHVTIQPRPDRKPHLFSLGNVAALLDYARELGCSPENRLVR